MAAARAFAEASPDWRSLLDTVARHAADLIGGRGLVLLRSDDGVAGHPLAARVLASGESSIATAADLESLRPLLPREWQAGGGDGALLVALRTREPSAGPAAGVLVLGRAAGDPPFDQHDRAAAESLADLAALAIANARLLVERKRSADRLQILTAASHEFTTSTNDREYLKSVVARRLGEAIGDMCSIRSLSPDGAWLEAEGAVYHRDPELLAVTRAVMLAGRHRVGEGITGRVAASGESVLIARIDTASFIAAAEPRYRDLLERLEIASLIAVPLICRGEVLGVVNLLRGSAAPPYDLDDLRLAESIADHAALSIGNARSYEAEKAARAVAEQASKALRESEVRFARLSESGIIGIVASDLWGRVTEVNDALLHMLGYAREDILSGRVVWRELTPSGWQDVDARAVEQLQTSGIGELREKEYLHKDGRRVPVMIGSARLAEGSDECISFVLDLTERKRAEAVVAQLREEQVAQRQRADLAAIVEGSDDAIIGKTLHGVITSWNPGAERLFGYPAAEVIGRSISVIIPPGREEEERSILSVLARGEVRRFETVRRRKDGREVDVSVTTSPVRDASGHITGISKVARDISERKRADEALVRARDAAESASHELEAFSYSVAHDLRAPLRGMNGFAQVLLDTYGDKFDDEGRDWLQEILLNARRMGALIDALLGLSRVSRGALKRESVDLSALARAVGAQLAAAEPARRVELVVQEGLHAELDPNLARSLVENLLGNAWKFTGKVGAARIELSATEKSGARVFSLRDNGAGFDMAYAGKLFAPFQRLHTTAEFPGTGVGLATVQRIVRRHGGWLRAEGVVDGGATFFFSLPESHGGGP